MTTHSFRDDYYRSLVDFAFNYDEVINMIIALNPAAVDQSKPSLNYPARFVSPEEFACSCVHSCIRTVLFGDGGSHCSTGGCIAVRLSNNVSSPNYKKVVLAYNGPFVVEEKPIVIERGKGVMMFAG
jgi:hypothetical protein